MEIKKLKDLHSFNKGDPNYNLQVVTQLLQLNITDELHCNNYIYTRVAGGFIIAHQEKQYHFIPLTEVQKEYSNLIYNRGNLPK